MNEYARVAVEQRVGLRFPSWAVVRRCALGLYFVVLVLWSLRYGIPAQRELAIAWTCGALVCVSLGRHPRQ